MQVEARDQGDDRCRGQKRCAREPERTHRGPLVTLMVHQELAPVRVDDQLPVLMNSRRRSAAGNGNADRSGP